MAALVAALGLALWAAPEASAHKFHASLANVDYNEEAKTAEISLRLFADDLEESLGRRAGSRVQLGLTPEAERLAFEYVRDAFRIADASGAPLALEWVGMEAQADVVWVYVEAPAPNGLAGASVADALFFDQFDDQVNLVVVKEGGRQASLVFKPGSGAQTVELR